MTHGNTATPSRLTFMALESLVVAIFISLIVAKFYNVLFGTWTFLLYPDTSDMIYPDFYSIAQSLKSGTFPLWNPHLFSGFPSASYPLYGIFYPLNIIFWMIPYPENAFPTYAYTLITLTHVFMAGWFMYILGRALGFTRSISVCIGVMYMFSPSLIMFTIWEIQLAAFAWFPLVFAFAYKAMSMRSLRHAAFGGLALGMLVLASPAQPAIQILMILFALAGFFLFTARKDRPGLLTIGKAFFVLLAVGMLIGSLTLLPVMEFTPFSIRFLGPDGSIIGNAKMPFKAFTSFKFSPDQWKGIFLPEHANADVASIFVGITTLVLAVLGSVFLFRKRPLVGVLSILCIIAILYSFGFGLPLIFFHIPFVNKIREPQRYAFFLAFLAPILAGFCLDHISNTCERLALLKRHTIASATIIVCILGAIGFSTLTSDGILRFTTAVISVTLIGLAVSFPWSKRLKAGMIYVLIGIAIGEMLLLPYAYIDNSKGRLDTFYKESQGLSALRPSGSESPFRVTAIEAGAWPYCTNSANMIRFYDTLGYGNPLLYRMFTYRNAVNFDSKYYDMLNVRYFVTYADSTKRITNLKSPNIKKAFDIANIPAPPYYSGAHRNIDVFENINRLGNAWLVDKWNVYEYDLDPIITIENNVDVSREAMLMPSKLPPGFIIPMTSSDKLEYTCKQVSYESNRIKYDITSNKTALLVLSELYYPGWEVILNGDRSELLEANYILRATFVPEGNSTIEFVYRPYTVSLGMTLALIGVLFSITILCIPLFAKWEGLITNTSIAILAIGFTIFGISSALLLSANDRIRVKGWKQDKGTFFDMLDKFEGAEVKGKMPVTGNPWGSSIAVLNVAEAGNRAAIFATAGCEIRYTNIKIPKSPNLDLSFTAGPHPATSTWTTGDGFIMQVIIESDSRKQSWVHEFINKDELMDITLPLHDFKEQEITISMSVSNAEGRNADCDWSLWIEPRIVPSK